MEQNNLNRDNNNMSQERQPAGNSDQNQGYQPGSVYIMHQQQQNQTVNNTQNQTKQVVNRPVKRSNPWITTLGVCVGVCLLPFAGLAGGLLAYISIDIGATIKQMEVTPYLGIAVILGSVISMLVLGVITKTNWKKKVVNYNKDIRRARNEQMSKMVIDEDKIMGGLNNENLWQQQKPQYQQQTAQTYKRPF